MKQKIRVILLGCVISIVFLECCLRAGSLIYSYVSRNVSAKSPATSHTYTVICLGNSYTYGSGAPKGSRYPDFLQQMSDRQLPKSNVRINNRGVVALNTAELVYELENLTGDLHPDMVILQIGEANRMNRYRFGDYLKREKIHSNELRSVYLRAQDIGYHFKVYKLVIFLRYSIKELFESKMNAREPRPMEYSELLRWLNDSMVAVMDEGRNMSSVFNDEKRICLATDVFKKATQDDPSNPINYYALGRLYCIQGQFDKGLETFIKGIRINPSYRGEIENRNYIGLRRLHEYSHDDKLHQKIRSFMREFSRTHPAEAVNLMKLDDEEILNWISADIDEIVKVLRERNIRIILQNYPPALGKGTNAEWRMKVNTLLREKAEDLCLPFVDNEKLFTEAFKADVDRSYYAADGHCNWKGYQLMAKNVFEVVVNELLLGNGHAQE